MRRPVPRLIAVGTACFIIAAVWLLVPGRQSTAQAFNKLAETLITARTARFQMEVDVEGQPKQKFQSFFFAPARFRNELALTRVVTIVDWSVGKIMTVIPATKQVVVMNIHGEAGKEKFQSQFDRLRELLSKSRDAKEDQYQRLAEKEIDGHRAVGFRYDSPAATVTLWGDAETGQPIRIETLWSGIPRTEATMTDFEINIDLKDSLFDLTPPAGYKVQSLNFDIHKPTERDLVDAFKVASDIGGGEFPDSLDTTGVSRLIIKYTMSHLAKPSEDATQRLMKQAMTMGLGFQFALELPETSDTHYAGKGVKRNAKDRPVFWYKQQGTGPYRVIYADLSVKEVAEAPATQGAMRIQKASKTTKPTPKR